MSKKPTAKKPSRDLFNMVVDAKFREAVRMLRHLDPRVPSAAAVVMEAVYEKLDRVVGKGAHR
jgi:hypothetical protein